MFGLTGYGILDVSGNPATGKEVCMSELLESLLYQYNRGLLLGFELHERILYGWLDRKITTGEFREFDPIQAAVFAVGEDDGEQSRVPA